MRTISISLPLFVLLTAGCAASADHEETGEAGEALTAGPDLQVTKVSGPASVAMGPFNVVATVCNKGTEPVYSTKVDFVLSQTSTIDPARVTTIGSAPVGPLTPNQCADVTASASTQNQGGFTLGAIVDPTNQTYESNENNNTRAGNLIGLGYGPDLVAKTIIGPTSAVPNTGISATVNVCNQGSVPTGGTTVSLVLSSDTAITSSDALVGTAPVNALDPGACADVVVNGAGAPAGTWYLGAVVDPANTQPELLEQNNTLLGKQIGIGYLADLVVTAVNHPADYWPGTNPANPVTATVCNNGTNPVNGAEVDLFLSTDAAISSADTPAGTAWVSNVYPGTCQTVPVDMSGNAYFLSGPYYLGAIVDPLNQVPELIETNNTLAGTLIGWGRGQDFVVSSITGPTVITSQTGPWTAHAKVCNQGTQDSFGAGPMIGLYLSSDTAITTADSMYGFVPAPALAAGACATVDIPAQPYTGPFWMPSPLYIGAIIDPQATVPELIETNNSRAGALVGIGDGPDLYVSAFSAPTDAMYQINATATVCNQGDEPSYADVVLYGSSTKTINPTDAHTFRAGFASIDAIAPGQCVAVTIPANLPPIQGQAYLQVVVDPQNYVPELLESNNVSAVRAIGIGYGSDLVVSISSLPATARFSDPIPATVHICNQGTVASEGGNVRGYWSTDATITTSDEPGFGLSFGPLATGKCVNLSENTFVSRLGTSYLGAIVSTVDGNELQTTNNTSAGRAITITQF